MKIVYWSGLNLLCAIASATELTPHPSPLGRTITVWNAIHAQESKFSISDYAFTELSNIFPSLFASESCHVALCTSSLKHRWATNWEPVGAEKIIHPWNWREREKDRERERERDAALWSRMALQTAISATQKWTKMEVKWGNHFGH